MSNFLGLLQHGNSWLFVPSAILLGALHGLEPGHSKTMMAAFIIAIRGTLAQAVLLGLAATVSHTAIVWAVALGGMYFGQRWNVATDEPYFQLASAALIVAVAVWMLWRTWRNRIAAREYEAGHAHHHGAHADHGHHGHGHDAHGAEAGATRRIDTGHGVLELSLQPREDGAHFRLETGDGVDWPADDVRIETERADGSRAVYAFVRHDGGLESVDAVAAPHEFIARVHLGHDRHSHDYDLEFMAGGHRHVIREYEALDLTAPGYQDPHELAHANDIRRRFANRQVTTPQIVLFGLTGGLMPCPASITVLLLCLQLGRFALGATLVLCFSIGLALTMVAVGAVAALGVQHAAKRFSGFGEIAGKAPFVSGVLILCVGLYLGWQALYALP